METLFDISTICGKVYKEMCIDIMIHKAKENGMNVDSIINSIRINERIGTIVPKFTWLSLKLGYNDVGDIARMVDEEAKYIDIRDIMNIGRDRIEKVSDSVDKAKEKKKLDIELKMILNYRNIMRYKDSDLALFTAYVNNNMYTREEERYTINVINKIRDREIELHEMSKALECFGNKLIQLGNIPEKYREDYRWLVRENLKYAVPYRVGVTMNEIKAVQLFINKFNGKEKLSKITNSTVWNLVNCIETEFTDNIFVLVFFGNDYAENIRQAYRIIMNNGADKITEEAIRRYETLV